MRLIDPVHTLLAFLSETDNVSLLHRTPFIREWKTHLNFKSLSTTFKTNNSRSLAFVGCLRTTFRRASSSPDNTDTLRGFSWGSLWRKLESLRALARGCTNDVRLWLVTCICCTTQKKKFAMKFKTVAMLKVDINERAMTRKFESAKF